MQNPTIAGIESKIFLIRGHKVLLDSDLASLYGVDTKVLNQAVRRNINRFPTDFMFQLAEIEWDFLKSQIVTSNVGRGGKQKLPLVFTEYGVALRRAIRGSISGNSRTDVRTFGSPETHYRARLDGCLILGNELVSAPLTE